MINETFFTVCKYTFKNLSQKSLNASCAAFKTFTGPLISFQIARQEINFYVYEEIKKSLPNSKKFHEKVQRYLLFMYVK